MSCYFDYKFFQVHVMCHLAIYTCNMRGMFDKIDACMCICLTRLRKEFFKCMCICVIHKVQKRKDELFVEHV